MIVITRLIQRDRFARMLLFISDGQDFRPDVYKVPYPREKEQQVLRCPSNWKSVQGQKNEGEFDSLIRTIKGHGLRTLSMGDKVQ